MRLGKPVLLAGFIWLLPMGPQILSLKEILLLPFGKTIKYLGHVCRSWRAPLLCFDHTQLAAAAWLERLVPEVSISS